VLAIEMALQVTTLTTLLWDNPVWLLHLANFLMDPNFLLPGGCPHSCSTIRTKASGVGGDTERQSERKAKLCLLFEIQETKSRKGERQAHNIITTGDALSTRDMISPSELRCKYDRRSIEFLRAVLSSLSEKRTANPKRNVKLLLSRGLSR
jgi:hypothetical protein